MSDRGRAALILGHNRQELLTQAIAAIQPQVDAVLVIDNASSPKLEAPAEVNLLYLPDQPPNIYRFWNRGFDFWESHFTGRPYDLAVLCDDAIVPAGWFEAVTSAMRHFRVVAGSNHPDWALHYEPVVKHDMDGDIGRRMCAWAFVMASEPRVRAPETMAWWYGDTAIDIDLRRAGGTVLIGGYPVPNRQPNFYTVTKPELGAQTGRDREAFAARYGSVPW